MNFCIRSFICALLFVPFAMFGAIAQELGHPVNAKLELRDGNEVQVFYIGPTSLFGKLNGQEYEIPFHEVKRIEFISENFGKNNGIAIVTSGNDIEFRIDSANVHCTLIKWPEKTRRGGGRDCFSYVVKNPITSNLESLYVSSPFKVIRSITFNHIEGVKVNPVSGAIYPDSFYFDPYDGRRLEHR